MPARIDLHTHSTASDGTTTPELLVRQAAEVGLDALALTDHDTTAGWEAAAAALPAGVRLVRGAEISCAYGDISLHLLAYLFDPDDAALAEQLAALRDSRRSRAERMVGLLAGDDVRISWKQVKALAAGTVGRPHIAQALVDLGFVNTVADAFTPEWIGTGGRYWAGKLELDVLEAIRLVAAAGGVTVFAHPGASARGRTVSDDAVRAMADAGLDGLEVDHPDHTGDAQRHLRALAAELDLLATGSSDFHGANKTVSLGDHLTPQAVYDELVARASGVPVL